jgi:hypothetical protein
MWIPATGGSTNMAAAGSGSSVDLSNWGTCMQSDCRAECLQICAVCCAVAASKPSAATRGLDSWQQ